MILFSQLNQLCDIIVFFALTKYLYFKVCANKVWFLYKINKSHKLHYISTLHSTFFKEINTFIQQGCIKLIKSDNKNINNVTKDFYLE